MTETKRIRFFGVLFLTLACMAEVLVAFSFDRGIRTMGNYVSILVFAFAGFTLLQGRYRRQIDLWVGAAFCAWFVISRIMLGETYLDYSFTILCNLCCAYLLCFPFARSMQDGRKKTGLTAAALVLSIGYTLLAWVSVLAATTGEMVYLPVLGTRIGIMTGRLEAGAHANISALLFLTALMMTVWLAAQKRRRWAIPLCLIAIIGLYTGIALTESRTVMLQAGFFIAGIVFLAVLRLPIKAVWKKTLIGLVVSAACVVVVFISFDWVSDGFSRFVNQMTAHAESVAPPIIWERDFFRDLTTMSGRSDIYQQILGGMIKDNPGILVTGTLNSRLASLLLEYTNVTHAHNSYLQTLINMGIPGLLMAVFFTVRAVWVSLKLIFSRKASFADQLLAFMLPAFLIGTISESYWFTEYLTAANMPFFLVLGYALETERTLRE